ncbi:A-kinase anchor protein 1, mitochondrial isoform X2 [Agrilus planipennis]|uniref:A-kinase anchor protein 1, mitochondrial isoform X2 n=1 Tax=Agrilus planipennis TaxID=224129 RepID=A0A1W4X4F2_AGRPL|nr:A-kinase anchor protein 1, mitochondrial isoform X2 [Agrilus planipennis]
MCSSARYRSFFLQNKWSKFIIMLLKEDSMGSSDSGKGGSDVVTPPPSRTPACDGSVSGDVPLHSIYEFLIPQNLVGRLIGRQGTFVTQIKEKTRAHIVIKKHPDNPKLKVCQIEGTQLEIDTALEMIRDKFPEKRYPELTLEQVSFLPPVSTVPLIPEHLCLKLIEGINNDTIVSCMVAPNHLFLQQPTHPTFPNLLMLSNCLNACYADASSPLLPNPIPENTVCIAQSLGAWYRALVLSTDLENEVSYVKFLDYGGYVNIPNSELRQIRADFLSLPFQASECVLANVKPIGGDDALWLDEAYTLVADLTKGSILYTQVVGFADERIPLVHIYIVLGPQSVVFLNGELVNRGFAEWIPSEDCNSMSNSIADSSTTIATEDQTLETTA